MLLQASQGASVEVDELDRRGQVLSHDAMFLEAPLQSHLIGILCAKPDVCQQVQSQISFSGTLWDQTEKGKYLKFVTIENPLDASWGYSPVGTLIVARPPWQMGAPQRDALENFARQGGTLILLDDQAHDPSFRSAYRPAGEGVGPATLGRGKVFFVQSLTSNVLGGFYAGANLVGLWRIGVRAAAPTTSLAGSAGDSFSLSNILVATHMAQRLPSDRRCRKLHSSPQAEPSRMGLDHAAVHLLSFCGCHVSFECF